MLCKPYWLLIIISSPDGVEGRNNHNVDMHLEGVGVYVTFRMCEWNEETRERVVEAGGHYGSSSRNQD
jgi:hypothetical protein